MTHLRSIDEEQAPTPADIRVSHEQARMSLGSTTSVIRDVQQAGADCHRDPRLPSPR
jgi:hypothetical protein